MRPLAWLLVGLIALLGAVRPALAAADVDFVAGLPVGEAAYGLVVGPDDLLYVGDIGGSRGTIFVFTRTGALVDRIQVPAGPSGFVALRGMAFDQHGNLYVADLANGQPDRGRVIKITPRGRQSVYASGLSVPTTLALDRSGVLYVADSLNGVVLWIGPDGASAPFIEDDRLRPRTRGATGISGLAFAPDESALYISNFSEDRILRLSIDSDGSAGRLSILADGDELRAARDDDRLLDGPEGLAVDPDGNVLVALSRSDAVERYSPRGRFLGRLPPGSGSAFSNPTSVAIAGRFAYVANLGLEDGLSHVSRFELAELDEE